MRKLFLILCFLLTATPFYALSNTQIKELMGQVSPLIEQEIKTVRTLPPSLPEPIYPLHLSGKKKGVLAEYNPRNQKILIYKNPLKKWWLQYQKEPDFPQLLARCLAPVYLHELLHARDDAFAQKHGFKWPITTGDEWVAVFWQTHFIKEKLKQNPDYYQKCGMFMPKAEFLQAPKTQLETFILKYYAFLPPPLSPNNINQLSEKKKIEYKGHIFVSKRRIRSLKSFFQKGGSWLELKPQELGKLKQDFRYTLYTNERKKQTAETTSF